jgi:hypothetical protein
MIFSRYCINQPTFSIVPVSQIPSVDIIYQNRQNTLKLLVKNYAIGVLNISLKNSNGEILLLDSRLLHQPNQIMLIFFPLTKGSYQLNVWQPYKKAVKHFTVD